MTLANTASKLLPRPVADWMRPRWHMSRELARLYREGGSLGRARDLSNWVGRRPFGPDGAPMYVVLRSYKELRRFVQFGERATDAVHQWMHDIKDCEVYFDVGSANGLEGFLVHHLHKCKVVFIEPSTFSVESTLKTIHLQAARSGIDRSRFEIVHAGCSDDESYARGYYHETPKPGATYVSFSDREDYCRGGRMDAPIYGTQWMKGVSLDSLVHHYNFPAPTHVKIDIDGFENKALRGAKRLLADRVVRSWAIEVTGEENIAEIGETMQRHGYREIAQEEHYPGYLPRTIDFIYVRN